MCFSSEASFTAAAVLGCIGVANFSQVRSKPQILLAALPLFFALQQFSEGLLWLSLSGGDPFYGEVGLYLFLFFALIFWPLWFPLSIFVLEEQPWRKKLIGVFMFTGFALSIVNFITGYLNPVSVKNVGFSLQYSGNVPSQNILYLAITLVPCFISSFPKLWQFGLLLALTAIIAQYFYVEVFLSLWCFASAICSLWLFKIFRDQPQPLSKSPKEN